MKTIESGLKMSRETQFTSESKKEAVNVQAMMLNSLLVSLNCFSQTSLSYPWCGELSACATAPLDSYLLTHA